MEAPPIEGVQTAELFPDAVTVDIAPPPLPRARRPRRRYALVAIISALLAAAISVGIEIGPFGPAENDARSDPEGRPVVRIVTSAGDLDEFAEPALDAGPTQPAAAEPKDPAWGRGPANEARPHVVKRRYEEARSSP
jgi:hypothetical protein